MSDGKIFSQKTKDLIVKVADDIVKLPFYAEPFDAPAFKLVLNFIESKADKFVPDSIDSYIDAGITAAIEGDLDAASENIGSALNAIIDIPLVEEDTEQALFVDGVRFVLRLINEWIAKKRATEGEKEL